MAPEEVRKEITVYDKRLVTSFSKVTSWCTHTLPERQENDQFNGEDLQERRVLRNIMTDLKVELNQAVHCN